MSFPVYSIVPPTGVMLPIVVSVPHAGTEVPPEVVQQLRPEILRELPDTDWFVPELYAFCKSLGIPMIQARLSRYVVDLNRPIEGPALYADQRRQTDAMPLTSFDGVPLYTPELKPSAEERQRRAQLYYYPYQKALQQMIADMQKTFPQVLLFDAHSIKRSVPSLAKEPFADMIVGDRDGASAHHKLSEKILQILRQSPYQIAYNQPFKGGHITRSFGHPEQKIHALQLEMSQDVYMNDDRTQLDLTKSHAIGNILQKVLTELAVTLEVLV